MFSFCFPSVATLPHFYPLLQGIWLFVYLQLVSIFTIPFRLCLATTTVRVSRLLFRLADELQSSHFDAVAGTKRFKP